MTITIEAPDLKASLMKAAAASNTTVDEYAARMLRLAFATEKSAGHIRSGYDKFACTLSSGEDFTPYKQEEKAREERRTTIEPLIASEQA